MLILIGKSSIEVGRKCAVETVLLDRDSKYSLIIARLVEQCSRNQCLAQTGIYVEGNLETKVEMVLFKLN